MMDCVMSCKRNERNTTPTEYLDNSHCAMWNLFPFIFRINDNYYPGQSALTILEQVCKERGWKEFGDIEEKVTGRNLLGWNLWWKSVVLLVPQSRSLFSWQYTNHIPRAINFCNKEYLARYISHMQEIYGDVFEICPKSFTVPKELELLEKEHEMRSSTYICTAMNYGTRKKFPGLSAANVLGCGDLNSNTGSKTDGVVGTPIWICKPLGKSQGKGIVLVDDLTNLPDHPVTIVQEYISKPLLISGYKFDLRLYVTIVSVSPLTIYIYREGLTRFSTERYDLNDLQNPCSHLTNVSINKLSPGYEKDKDTVGHGCKWSLRKLRKHLNASGYTDWFLWQKIMGIIVLTILGEIGHHSHSQAVLYNSKNSFEFLGYDILVDSNLRPWLLETNLSPGLGGDCAIDETVKRPMLHDLFDLLGLPDYRRRSAESKEKRNKISKHGDAGGGGGGNSKAGQITRIESLLTPPASRLKNHVHLGEGKETRAEPSKSGGRFSKSTTKLSSGLRARLDDVHSIYRQNSVRKIKIESSRRRFKNSSNKEDAVLAELPFNANEFLQKWLECQSNEKEENCKSGAEMGSSMPLEKNEMGSFTRRNWYDAPERQGDWIRVFPFNYNHLYSRGLSGTNTKSIIKNLQEFLSVAEIHCKNEPNGTDEYYNSKIRESIQWNNIIWLPPMQ